MYLVLSAFTSSPISLVAATKASAFSFRVCSQLYSPTLKYTKINRSTTGGKACAWWHTSTVLDVLVDIRNMACGSAGVILKARDNLEELSEDGRIL